MNCEPGFFNDVFLHLKRIVAENPSYAECSIIADAMSIKQSVYYNKATGSYDGYVNFGEGIVVPDDNIVAKEALVFMLVSFKGQWKYPVGYILDDKIDGKNLHCLLSRLLDLCLLHNLKVRCITLDGTSVNFNAMKLFGCKQGKQLNEINSTFTYMMDTITNFSSHPIHRIC